MLRFLSGKFRARQSENLEAYEHMSKDFCKAVAEIYREEAK